MTRYNMVDTKRPDGFYVTFERIEEYDGDANPREYLFQDEDYADADQARLDAWNKDEWHFIGIQARAHCLVVRSGMGTHYTLTSAGLWGVESDIGADYLEEVYREQVAVLKADIAAMVNPIYSEG